MDLEKCFRLAELGEKQELGRAILLLVAWRFETTLTRLVGNV